MTEVGGVRGAPYCYRYRVQPALRGNGETIGTNSGMLGVETLTKPVGLMELHAALIPPED